MARFAKTYEGRDRIMAFYAPIGLLSLVAVWMGLLVIGYTLIYRAISVDDWVRAFELSGSSFFTLGFVSPPDRGRCASHSRSPRRRSA